MERNSTPHLLEADGIQLTLGGRVLLSDVYLRVTTGQVVGLLGRNGCGKSTLLQAVFGTQRVADASVRVDGRRVVPAYRQPGLLSYLPQVPLLPAHLTATGAARLLGVDVEQALAAFPELLEQRHRPVGELSGGTARLLEVLLLLHTNTAFSLLDEPFTGVMPVHIDALAQVIRDLKQRKGILLTDHRYAEVLALCDVVYLLHDGRLECLPDPLSGLRDRGYLK
ncbi:ATP-binding cassette domain-containing protein [Hymenobacter rubripertinctus]|nr:ATP-binding cassette domain-containing protein [Hymenobacter rubripertinctus]